ncbi:hypothetical protein ACI6Q2_09565 [Chitinophagaceae bacterium LWZ2-11]
MKTTVPVLRKLFLFIFLLSTLAGIGQITISGNDMSEKAGKSYTKTYPVSGSEKITVSNRFGKMLIKTWDKNEVKVDVNIEVGTSSKEYSQYVLNKINIIDGKTADSISFKTKIENLNYGGDDNNDKYQNIQIDYEIHVPRNIKLAAENSFGPLSIEDYTGEVELFCKYGTLTAGKLENAKKVTIEFGKGYMNALNNTNLFFKYSKIDIKHLAGTIIGQFEFCSAVDIEIDNKVKSLDLKSNYTTFNIGLDKGIAADYNIVTNNGRLSSGFVDIKEDKSDKPSKETNSFYNSNYSSVHRYSGSIGSGGGTQINIKTNFGSVKMM